MLSRDLENGSDEEVFSIVREARRNRTFDPYSEYSVGAGIISGKKMYIGSNIEISGRSTSVHGEMMAVLNAIMMGEEDLEKLYVAPEAQSGVASCGLCQHFLSQFVDDIEIVEDCGVEKEPETYMLSDIASKDDRELGKKRRLPGSVKVEKEYRSERELAEIARELCYNSLSKTRAGALLVTENKIYEGIEVSIGRGNTINAANLAVMRGVMNNSNPESWEKIVYCVPNEKALCGREKHTVAQFVDDIRIVYVDDLAKCDTSTVTLQEQIGPAYSPSTRHSDLIF